MIDPELLAKLENPKALLQESDPVLVEIGLSAVMREPSDDPEIIDLIEKLLDDTRFARIGYPFFWSSIRLYAGFALTAIRRLQGNKEKVIVKNTPMVITLEDRDILETVRPFELLVGEIGDQELSILIALQKAYEAGVMSVRDFAIPLDGTMDYKEVWRAVNLDRQQGR